jgi:hypothetical protein
MKEGRETDPREGPHLEEEPLEGKMQDTRISKMLRNQTNI